jgi:hypothetical protein
LALAGGHDEQPWLVKSSTTAFGFSPAAPGAAEAAAASHPIVRAASRAISFEVMPP